MSEEKPKTTITPYLAGILQGFMLGVLATIAFPMFDSEPTSNLQVGHCYSNNFVNGVTTDIDYVLHKEGDKFWRAFTNDNLTSWLVSNGSLTEKFYSPYLEVECPTSLSMSLGDYQHLKLLKLEPPPTTIVMCDYRDTPCTKEQLDEK